MLLFFAAQIVGLFLLNKSIASVDIDESGEIAVTYSDTLYGRPELEGSDSFTYTLSMIFVGTAILLFLIKFRLYKVWKAWFFLAIFGALSISFAVLLPEILAISIALVFAYLKLYKPNIIVHNITEVFMYAGIAILIAPLFTVFWMLMMLLVISVYDAIAVWKSKHMIKLAKAQADSKMFAGLLIPYTKKHKSIKVKIPKGMQEKGIKTAILGGGDIAFPLLFAGSVMTSLIENNISNNIAFLLSLLIPLFSGIALLVLLLKSQKDKFYPAMPFITIGCLTGYGIILFFH
jgi:presenilin-like A22 family membrane protease